MRSDFCRAICTLTSWKRTGVKSLKSTPTSYIVGVHMLRTRSESQPRLPVLLVWTCPNKCQVRLFSCPPFHKRFVHRVDVRERPVAEPDDVLVTQVQIGSKKDDKNHKFNLFII